MGCKGSRVQISALRPTFPKSMESQIAQQARQGLADARPAIDTGSQAADLILLRQLAGKYGGATAGTLEKLLADAADPPGNRARLG